MCPALPYTTNAPQVMPQNDSVERNGMNGMKLRLKLSRRILPGQLCGRRARVAVQTDETDGQLARSKTPSRLMGKTEQAKPVAQAGNIDQPTWTNRSDCPTDQSTNESHSQLLPMHLIQLPNVPDSFQANWMPHRHVMWPMLILMGIPFQSFAKRPQFQQDRRKANTLKSFGNHQGRSQADRISIRATT